MAFEVHGDSTLLVISWECEEDPGIRGGDIVEGFDFPVFRAIFENEWKLGRLNLLALGINGWGF